MKKKYFFVLTAAALLILRTANFYGQEFEVVEVAEDMTTLENSRGDLFTLSNVGYSIGDHVYCIMDDNETPGNTDDHIIYHHISKED